MICNRICGILCILLVIAACTYVFIKGPSIYDKETVFSYGQKVKVIKGFYKGYNCFTVQHQYTDIRIFTTDRYYYALSSKDKNLNMIMVYGDELELEVDGEQCDAIQ